MSAFKQGRSLSESSEDNDAGHSDHSDHEPSHRKRDNSRHDARYTKPKLLPKKSPKRSTKHLSASSSKNDHSDDGSDQDDTNNADSDDDERKGSSKHPRGDSDLTGRPPKKSKLGNYSSVSMKLMKRMGYQEGKGLGKDQQGREDIIPESKQRGRRGLGLSLEGLEPSPDLQWDSSKEEIAAKEPLEWIPKCAEGPPAITELRQWMVEGPKKLTIDDETLFCDSDVLKEVLTCKNVFDRLEPEEMRKARSKSNPFETIRGGIFQNRAAMKMANIDYATDFMFTIPKTEEGKQVLGPDDLLYFADVCAGPGGFSEYVLWRKGWQAKGFGFTLRGPNDFKLEEFFAGPPDTFEPHYGVNEQDGDGDIFNTENIRAFSKFVKNSTDGKGVHFVMADGGFSVEGQENLQEILSKRLYLCQFYTALSILRDGGHFVCKLFDVFTQFSVGLVYLMYRAFEQVCIFKPNTSRPANSERYLVCKWRREGTKDIQDYMYELCCRFQQISSATSTVDILEVVPLEILNDDDFFFNYILNSNNKLGRTQIIHLTKIKAFAQNTDLHDGRQNSLRKECLQLWKVPDQARSEPKRHTPEAKYKELMNNAVPYFDSKPDELTSAVLQKLNSVYDYRCIVCGEGKPGVPDNKFFFLGVGRRNVYQWSGNTHDQWKKISDNLELPSDTLFYGEMVQEFEGEGRQQKRFNTVHIIDALVLGKVDVRSMHYDERMKWVRKFVKATSKPTRYSLMPLRAKEVFHLENIEELFERVSLKIEKGASRNKRLSCSIPQESRDKEEKHFYPTGVLFLRVTKKPWHKELSRSTNQHYFYNKDNGKNSYEQPLKSIADFKACFTTAALWPWSDGVRVLSENVGDHADDGKVHRQTLVTFVRHKLSR